MKNVYDFFSIEREHLLGKRVFPFQIYIYNPVHKNFNLFLNGNSPLTDELDLFLDYLLEKGGKLSILRSQRRTFLAEQELTESQIPSLGAVEQHELEKELYTNIKLRENFETKNGPLIFQSEFELACETDDFSKIIEYARVEILTFSVTESKTVSLAIELAKVHLIGDDFLNRIVAVSYYFAKTLDIKDVTTLSDIIAGAYLSHIGYTQLSSKLLITPRNQLDAKDKALYEKHTILSNHLIKKSHLEITQTCQKIIMDHHERINGGGYPAMKYENTIAIEALIVGAISHVFEFSSGRMNGKSRTIKSVINSIKTKTHSKGLEFDFGSKVLKSLVTIINTEKIEEKKS